MDNGAWRRLTVVPFQAVISERNGVQNYAEVLTRNAGEAILSWAIEGAGNFIRNGCKLDIPDAVEEATDACRQREDWLNSFLKERCIRDERARTAARALYMEQAKRYQDTLKLLQDRLRDSNGTESVPLSEKDARAIAQAAKEGNSDPRQFCLRQMRLLLPPSQLIGSIRFP